jgi:hypothetical protein
MNSNKSGWQLEDLHIQKPGFHPVLGSCAPTLRRVLLFYRVCFASAAFVHTT